MKMKIRAAVGSLLVTAVAAGAAVVPASSQAAEPGQVCNIGGYVAAAVYPTSAIGGQGFMYLLAPGAGFRVVAYGPGDTYYGRGNGQANGYLWRGEINQSSCHW